MKIHKGGVVPGFLDCHEWAACFGLSLAHLLLHDQATSARILRPNGMYLRKVAGTMGVAEGRNEIARAFLATDAEWLWMVDTDMGFGPDTVDRLVASAEANHVKVLGGLAFALKADTSAVATHYGVVHRIVPTLYSMDEVVDTGEVGFRPMADYKPDAFQEVAGTGAACLLIHRRVLETLGPDPFRPLVIRGAGGNGTDRPFSEDLSFCLRVTAAGIRIGVDTSIKTTHYKGAQFLDEDLYLRQRALQEVPA